MARILEDGNRVEWKGKLVGGGGGELMAVGGRKIPNGGIWHKWAWREIWRTPCSSFFWQLQAKHFSVLKLKMLLSWFCVQLLLTLTKFLLNLLCRILLFRKCLSSNFKKTFAILVEIHCLNGGLHMMHIIK